MNPREAALLMHTERIQREEARINADELVANAEKRIRYGRTGKIVHPKGLCCVCGVKVGVRHYYCEPHRIERRLETLRGCSDRYYRKWRDKILGKRKRKQGR